MTFHIGRGSLKGCDPKNSLIVTTENLKGLFGEDHIIIPQDKSVKTYDQIHKELFARGARRDTSIIAMGGGTVLDVVAFATSTFMRGLPLTLIPTSLLAMVDACIGGKTAIDTPFGKNLIGSFYFPQNIYIDFDLLKTLPSQELENGFMEVLKMGLIYDRSIFGTKATDEIYTKAIEAKRDIVRADPKEKGVRRILNFGHTIGHGLEVVGEGMAHGRAVALGCIAESFLSMQLGFLKKEEFEEIESFYQQFNLSLPVGYERKALLETMRFDKKNTGREVRFCLIDRIGHALKFNGDYCLAVSDLETTLDYLETYETNTFSRKA